MTDIYHIGHYWKAELKSSYREKKNKIISLRKLEKHIFRLIGPKSNLRVVLAIFIVLFVQVVIRAVADAIVDEVVTEIVGDN